MIQKINSGVFHSNNAQKPSQQTTSPIQGSNVVPLRTKVDGDKLALALQAQNGIPMAKTVSFGGVSFLDTLKEKTKDIIVCEKENVGNQIAINPIIDAYAEELPKFDDAIKTTIRIGEDKENFTVTDARVQVKRKEGENILFEMLVHNPRAMDSKPPEGVPAEIQQKISLTMNPKDEANPQVYIMNTKGKLTAVVEDNQDVLLTNSKSTISDKGKGIPLVKVTQDKTFVPFTIPDIPAVKKLTPQPSIGVGSKMIIGMEQKRFCAEIVESIREFEAKVNNDEIVLPQFVAKKGAEKIELAMLAGGFGSRAEYANAISDGIFHGQANGAQSTKGVFRTPTGYTPMETTFISLHMAGLLDCSKGNFGIGKNVEFYLNKSRNDGNGGFTMDLYEKERKTQDCEFIFPNDSISRMPIAIAKVTEIMTKGETAVAMIAKKIPVKQALNKFGIMKLSDKNEILEFAEKPPEAPPGYVDEEGNCLTNTFQFAVSKEAFAALKLIEPYFSGALKGKETRDWSKHLIPTIMLLSEYDDPDMMRSQLPRIVGQKNNRDYLNFLDSVPDSILLEAKDLLKGQKVVAVPTEEAWADVGQLSSLYDVTMDIAKGKFELLDFERKNVIDSINPQTGLVAMTPEQKASIESQYNIEGEVIAVPKAKKVEQEILDDYSEFIHVNSPKTKK